MGGMGIFRVGPDGLNLGSIIETLNRTDNDGDGAALPEEIVAGDKRILLIDGVPVPYALARIPQGSEIRGNLAVGGKGVAQPLSARDREIAEAIGPMLAARGLLVVGLDVIGDCLTEINVTSPTGFQEIGAADRLRRRQDVRRCARATRSPRRARRSCRPVGSVAAMAVLSLSDAHLAFGHVALLDGASLSLEAASGSA